MIEYDYSKRHCAAVGRSELMIEYDCFKAPSCTCWEVCMSAAVQSLVSEPSEVAPAEPQGEPAPWKFAVARNSSLDGTGCCSHDCFIIGRARRCSENHIAKCCLCLQREA